MSATDSNRSKQIGFLIRYTLQSASIIVLLAILLRVFFVSSYVMSGASMLPSVWPGDFLVAFKWGAGGTKRGDVVALHCPGVRERTCLKRVVGVAGDRIEFRSGQLFINGLGARRRQVSPEIVVEGVGVKSWLVWPADQTGGPQEPVIVPPLHVYLLNDKRIDAEDSRTWGPLATSELEGRARFVWLSLDWFENGRIREWPRPRWHRMLRSID